MDEWIEIEANRGFPSIQLVTVMTVVSVTKVILNRFQFGTMYVTGCR